MVVMPMELIRSRQKSTVNETWTCGDPNLPELREKGAQAPDEQICP
jgi:hypothetical protein